MYEAALVIGTGIVTFIANWAAMRVHLQYLRRDVDHAHERIDRLERVLL
ncbi:MAG TPA: hypothetical protein VIE69_06995 [Methylophilaceae bacterium]|jgi:hypothetical protein